VAWRRQNASETTTRSCNDCSLDIPNLVATVTPCVAMSPLHADRHVSPEGMTGRLMNAGC
jgi:hypothetical protein